MAFDALEAGGSMPIVYNAANEGAVARFLKREIDYWQISDMIERTMSKHQTVPCDTVEDVLGVEDWTYRTLAGI